MATTVSAFITDLDSKMPNAYGNADKLSWINDVELNDYADVAKAYANKYYSRTANTDEYTLPSGVAFTEIRRVFVEGRQYNKVDLRANKQYRSYWLEGGEIKVYPIPDKSDTSYTSGASEITFAIDKITTTGDSFTGFSVGDIIEVSGCTDNTANNKYARIVSTSETVFTFPTGTFAAQAESAEVTISAPKVRVVYQSLPAEKLIADVATDTLLLPDRFKNVYTYYCMAQIALLNQEFNQYNNYVSFYMKRFNEFEEWWENNRPLTP